jgi:hypothetical protein
LGGAAYCRRAQPQVLCASRVMDQAVGVVWLTQPVALAPDLSTDSRLADSVGSCDVSPAGSSTTCIARHQRGHAEHSIRFAAIKHRSAMPTESHQQRADVCCAAVGPCTGLLPEHGLAFLDGFGDLDVGDGGGLYRLTLSTADAAIEAAALGMGLTRVLFYQVA